MNRDGHMRGDRITILERLNLPVGRWTVVGARKEGSSSEVVERWRNIPSASGIYSVRSCRFEPEGASVLDEFYWLNNDDPNYSLQHGIRPSR